MTVLEILNLIAIIVIPIFAVLIGQYLQIKVSKRNEKIRIFKRLMTYRNIGYFDMTSVEYLNQIPILFIKDKKVMDAYNKFIQFMNKKDKDLDSNNEIEKAKKKLLETMAHSLHYSKINWEIIETPYLPPETIEKRIKGEKFSEEVTGFFSNLSQILSPENKEKIENMLELSLKAQKEEFEKSKKKNSEKTTKHK